MVAFIGVEDPWLTATFKSQLQSLHAEPGCKAGGELPAEHESLAEIDDLHQVEEAFLQRGYVISAVQF